jgi:hypothetical protein
MWECFGVLYLLVAIWTAAWHNWQYESKSVIALESIFWPLTYVRIVFSEL